MDSRVLAPRTDCGCQHRVSQTWSLWDTSNIWTKTGPDVDTVSWLRSLLLALNVTMNGQYWSWPEERRCVLWTNEETNEKEKENNQTLNPYWEKRTSTPLLPIRLRPGTCRMSLKWMRQLPFSSLFNRNGTLPVHSLALSLSLRLSVSYLIYGHLLSLSENLNAGPLLRLSFIS